MGEFVRNLIAGLSERERRLVGIAGLIFFVFVIFLFVFLVRTKIGDLEDDNIKYTNILRFIDQKEQDFLEQKQKSRQSKSRSTAKPTPLRTLVDKIGRQLNVTVQDVKELPDHRHNSNWLEHAVELSMREIGLFDLTKFMEEVRANRRRFPIAITKLEIRKRKRVQDTYDIKMVIATYEQAKEEVAPGKRPSGSGRKGGR